MHGPGVSHWIRRTLELPPLVVALNTDNTTLLNILKVNGRKMKARQPNSETIEPNVYFKKLEYLMTVLGGYVVRCNERAGSECTLGRADRSLPSNDRKRRAMFAATCRQLRLAITAMAARTGQILTSPTNFMTN